MKQAEKQLIKQFSEKKEKKRKKKKKKRTENSLARGKTHFR